MKMIQGLGIDLCVDAGANVGRYGSGLREYGYRGRIESIEPSTDAFRQLRANSSGDERWTVHRLAVGDRPMTLSLNVTANSVSSSLMIPANNAFNSAVGAITIKTEEVRVIRLDKFIPEIAPHARKVFLKLDIQGFEQLALEGCEGVLDRVPLIELELGMTPLYEGAGDWFSIINWMRGKGYEIVAVQPNTLDAYDRTIEINAIFERQLSGALGA